MRRYVPNILTSYRVFAAAPVCLLVSEDDWVAALILLMGGFATDLADGYLARYWNVASPLDGFGKRLDVFADRTLIIAPVIGMVVAGNLGQMGILLLPLWVAVIYAADWLFCGRLDAANTVLWTSGYVLTGWQALEHLPLDTWGIFVGVAVMFIGIGALTHTALVRQAAYELGIWRRQYSK